MALDLSKLSDEMESALANARLLAEGRRQALIQPEHLLLLLLDGDGSSLRPTLERKGVVFPALLDGLSRRADALSAQRLDEGRRPLASQALRTMLAESFDIAAKHGRESAEPVDVLEAALTGEGSNELRNDFRKAGFTVDSLEQPAAPAPAASQAKGAESAPAPKSADGDIASGPKMLEKFGRDLTAAAAGRD